MEIDGGLVERGEKEKWGYRGVGRDLGERRWSVLESLKLEDSNELGFVEFGWVLVEIGGGFEVLYEKKERGRKWVKSGQKRLRKGPNGLNWGCKVDWSGLNWVFMGSFVE